MTARAGSSKAASGGPLPVSDLGHPDLLSAAFIEAAAERGLPLNPDFNGASQEGAGFFQTTTRHGSTANVEGLKILRKILQALAPYVVEEVDPGAKASTDEELLGFCRQRGSTIYHLTSTCRMGSDPLAVVDARLRLRGIDGLRVVDASVVPDLVSGNTNTAVIMIAEKASEMILEDA